MGGCDGLILVLSVWPHLSDHVEARAVVFWDSAWWVGVEVDLESGGREGGEKGGDDVEEEGHGVEWRRLRKIERSWFLDCCKGWLVPF